MACRYSRNIHLSLLLRPWLAGEERDGEGEGVQKREEEEAQGGEIKGLRKYVRERELKMRRLAVIFQAHVSIVLINSKNN